MVYYICIYLQYYITDVTQLAVTWQKCKIQEQYGLLYFNKCFINSAVKLERLKSIVYFINDYIVYAYINI